ncbi:MAG TPA: response regulator [Pyrinomonadaceae bacterium]|jgi:CheY-like chemotaxis protein|nr:response regulator [Pyrinomonadaceae bacterium]
MAKTVLVIEDEDALQDAIKRKLGATGNTVVSAMTAESGLKQLEELTPDLIWLDLLLPGMGGFQFLQHLRKEDRWKNIPVMVVSVSASPEKIQQAFQLNVVDYVVKSQYRLEDIVKKVTDLLDKKGVATHI